MTTTPVPLPLGALPAEQLLGDLLAVSMTGVIYYTPIYDPAGSGEIVDFTFVYLNPAAQRMMAMPEVPTVTHNQQWPHSKAHGTFAFHVEAFVTGEPREYNVNYQADGYDNYYRLAARRSGDGLLVSFTDTADQPRSPVEVVLRAAQAAEQAARADAESQRAQLHGIFEQAPAMICIFDGPAHVFQFVNPPYQALVGNRPLVGKPIAEAMPELAGQPIFGLLDQVYHTGETFHATEMLVQLDHDNTHPSGLEKRYYNFIYQARRDPHGTIDGILVFAYEVTPQVLARQQVQALHDAQQVTNTELHRAQQKLEQLNQELEARVQERTQALHAQQARLEEILGKLPASIALLTGPEHRHAFFNESYRHLSGGRAQAELPFADVYPEEVGQDFRGLLGRVYTSGQPYYSSDTLVERLDAATGQTSPHYLDFLYQPLPDAQGQTQSILVFAVEVTEKVRARQQAEALQAELLGAARQQVQERESFQAVFEQTPALIALLRAPGHRIEYVNPAYQAVFPDRQLVGRDLAQAVPEMQQQGFLDILNRVYRTGETYYGNDTAFERPAGAGQPAHTAYYNFTYQAYRESGQVAGVSIFAFDVTEQVLARQQREIERQQLQDLFEQAPVAIGILRGPEYIIEVANPLVAQIWGRPQSQVLGRPLFDALPEVRDQGFKELLDQVRRSGEAFVAEGIAAHLLRGESIQAVYLNFVYQPLRDAHGAVTSVAAVATDVTAQVQDRKRVQELNEQLASINGQLQTANAELGTSNQQLTRTNVDLDNFIYTASHDLKAPITNIEGLLQMLQAELLPQPATGEVAQVLDLMHGAVERFKTTLLHLSDVTKLQKEHAQPATQVHLAPVVEDVLLDLQPVLAESGARLEVDVAACPTVSFSPKNLRSVVYNLVSNALKYRHPDRVPLVRIGCRQEERYVVLTVQDNGLGIPADRYPELFEMFRRLHAHVEGSGVGLYMVKRSVENVGGRVEVESEVGAGSTFSVYFPHEAPYRQG